MPRSFALPLLAVSILSLSALPARAVDLGFFATGDYYLRSGVEDDIEDANANAVQAIGTANGEVTTTNGYGGRVGLRGLAGDIMDLGFSVGYVVGPEIESVIDSPNGRVTQTTETQFIRVLAEAGFRVPLSEKVYLRLGGGAGLARAEVDQTNTGSLAGFTVTTDGSEDEQAFTWEVSPAIVFAGEDVDVELGARYAEFPKIDATNETPEIDWTALGFYLGIAFR